MPTTTITSTTQQAARIVHAVGKRMGLKNGGGVPRDATEAEVKAFLIAYLRAVVLETEREEVATTPLDLT